MAWWWWKHGRGSMVWRFGMKGGVGCNKVLLWVPAAFARMVAALGCFFGCEWHGGEEKRERKMMAARGR